MDILSRLLKGIALGFLQGLTEFLPVSSSGHLLLLEKGGLAEPSLTLNLFLHIATLLSVAIGMRKSLYRWIKHPFSSEGIWIYVASIPTLVIAIIFKLFFEELLLGKYVIPCFLVTAIILLIPKPKYNREPNLINAIFAGISQGFAVLPGLSRSGCTITALRLSGIDEKKSVELSFLMSVPVIIGGFIVELKDFTYAEVDILILISSFITAFIVGLISLKAMRNAFNEKTSILFSAYLVLVSIVHALL